jgi:DNA polymerase I-like protein with 3'-5' exonuclease and polymerase domains
MRFHRWQQCEVQIAREQGYVRTRLGWQAAVYESTLTTTLFNWLIQAHGADVLRVATLLLASQGLQVVSTIHDAVVLTVPEAELSVQQPLIVDILTRAAAVVIGAPIRVDVKVVRPGERLLTS